MKIRSHCNIFSASSNVFRAARALWRCLENCQFPSWNITFTWYHFFSICNCSRAAHAWGRCWENCPCPKKNNALTWYQMFSAWSLLHKYLKLLLKQNNINLISWNFLGLVMHGYNIVHGGDLNENDNLTWKLVIHGYMLHGDDLNKFGNFRE